MKRFFLIFIAILVLAAGGFWIYVRQVAARYQVYLDELKTLEEYASAANAVAQKLSSSGRYDLEITLQSSLIEELLQELRGFVNISRRGSRLEIHTVSPQFHEGFIRVDAQADLDSPYYSGPVTATYYAFAGLAGDGRCRLEFRTVSARATEGWLRHQAWIEPFLVFRLQKKLKIPELTLPFGIEKQLSLPSLKKTVSRKRFELDIPGRDVHLKLEHPRIMMTAQGLGVLVESISFDSAGTPASQHHAGGTHTKIQSDGALRVALRLAILSQLMENLLIPEKDILIAAKHVPDAWHKESKVLGIEIENHADLHDVTGYVNLTRGAISVQNQLLYLDLGVESLIEGRISGKAWGIDFDRPFQMTSNMVEEVPVKLSYQEDDLILSFTDHPLILKMKFRFPVGSRHISIPHELDLTSKELLRPVVLPRWLHKTVNVPTKVERKKIVTTRPADLALTWRLHLPPDTTGNLIIAGDLKRAHAEEEP